MYKPFEEFFTELQEKNEYKMSDNYKKLSPKIIVIYMGKVYFYCLQMNSLT